MGRHTIEIALKAAGEAEFRKAMEGLGKSADDAANKVHGLGKDFGKSLDTAKVDEAVAAIQLLKKEVLEEMEAERKGASAVAALRKEREASSQAARIAAAQARAGVDALSEEGRAIAAQITKQGELRRELGEVLAARKRELQALGQLGELKRATAALQEDIAAHRLGERAVQALAQTRRIAAAQARAGVAAEDALGKEIREQIILQDRLQAELKQTMAARGGAGASAAGGGLGSAVGSMQAMFGKALAIYGTVMAIKGSFQGLVGAAAESEAAMAQLEAGVRSTGGAAGFTAQQLADMASEVSRATGKDDELVMGAEKILLTFQRIKGEQFFSALTDAMDVAQKKGMDLEAAAALVGKAFSGEFAGLKKAGVILTESQEKAIKKLFETGHAIEAQALLHKALQEAVGGSAKAYRDTLGGALDAAKTETGNLVEILAGELSPVIRQLTEEYIEWAQSAEVQQELAKWGKLLAGALAAVADAARILAPAFKVLALEFRIILGIATPLLKLIGGLATAQREAARIIADSFEESRFAVGAYSSSVTFKDADIAVANHHTNILNLKEAYGKLTEAQIVSARAAMDALTAQAASLAAEKDKIDTELRRRGNWEAAGMGIFISDSKTKELENQSASLGQELKNLANIQGDLTGRLKKHEEQLASATGGTGKLTDAQKSLIESARAMMANLKASVEQQAKKTAAATKSAAALRAETLAQEQAAKADEIRAAFARAGLKWSQELTDQVYAYVKALRDLKTQQDSATKLQELWLSVRLDMSSLDKAIADANKRTVDADLQFRRETFEVNKNNQDSFAAQRQSVQDQLVEQATFFRESLTTPHEELERFRRQIKMLADAIDPETGRPYLEAAEAQRLLGREARRSTAEQLEAWTGFLNYLGDAFGGFFAQVAAMANSVQNVRGAAKSLGGWSSMAGAMGGTFAAFVEAYKFADSIIKEHKSKKYGTVASVGRTGGLDVASYNLSGSQSIQRASLELVRSIQDSVKALEDALRISITDLDSITIKVRNDGESVQAWLGDLYVGTFADVNEAIRNAAMAALQKSGSASGMSKLMAEGLARWTSPDMDGLVEFLQKLRTVGDLTLGPLAAQLQAGLQELDRLREAVNQLDQASQEAQKAQLALTRAQLDMVEQTKAQLLGIDQSAAQALKSLAGLQEGMPAAFSSIREGIENQIAVAQARLDALNRKSTGLPNGGQGGQGVGGGKAPGGTDHGELIAVFLDGLTGGIDDETSRLKAAIEEYKKQLAAVPQALTLDELDLGIFTSLEGYLRKSGKHSELIAKFERMRVDAQFQAIKLQLLGIGAWERWGEIWQELYNEAMAGVGKPMHGGGGGGSKSDDRKSLREEIDRILVEARGSLHLVFFDLAKQIEDLRKRAKDSKLPLSDLTSAIAALQEQARKQVKTQMDALAGIGTDFTRQLDEGLDFFKQLRELGRGKTGIPDWKVDVREQQFKERMVGDFQARLGEFGGLANPMLAIQANAAKLRQELGALAEQGLLSADQIAQATKDIAEGEDYQRQQGVNSLLDRLYAWAKQAGINVKNAIEHERQKALLDVAIIEAQLNFFHAMTEETQGIIDGIRDFIKGPGFGGPPTPDEASSNAEAWYQAQADAAERWKEAAEAGRDAVENWRKLVDDFARAAKASLTDESVTGLSQMDQLSAAEKNAKDLYARAMKGDTEAAGQLMAALNEWRKEGMESYGGGAGSDQIWQEYLKMARDFLANAPAQEGDIYKKAMDAALANDNANTQAITAAVYAGAQEVVKAINQALGNIPGYASGGYVATPRLAWLAEKGPEIVTPVSNIRPLMPRLPKPTQGDGDVVAILARIEQRLSALEAVVTNTGDTARNTRDLADTMERQRRKVESDAAFGRRKL